MNAWVCGPRKTGLKGLMTESLPAHDFISELQLIKDRGGYRYLNQIESPQGPVISCGGRELINFCSNDYLGLANDERLVAALCRAAEKYGVGSGASPLVCGRSEAHDALEKQIAEYTGRDRALVFSSGYLANLAVVATLAPGRNGRVYEDRLNHASLIDGAILSRSRLARYKHRDTDALAAMLRNSRGRTMVISDAVFSMDGDIAPLAELAEICARYQALLAVDDAHGFGVNGDKGKGSLSLFGLEQGDVPVLILTFGKAVGVSGAGVVGPEEIIEMLIQKARPYIYSTAMPPALAAAVTESLRIIHGADTRRLHLRGLIGRFRRGIEKLSLPVMDSETPIQPLIIGDNDRAMAMSRKLYERGFLVTAIRPPTVPPNSARLRITLTAAHSEEQIDRLLEALADTVNAVQQDV